MTARCALALALLEGRVLTIFNCMKDIGFSNLPREVSRAIEKPFGVIVSRTPKETTNRYGDPIRYFEYRLNSAEYIKEGRQKMIDFVRSEVDSIPKTDRQATVLKALKQVEMFQI